MNKDKRTLKDLVNTAKNINEKEWTIPRLQRRLHTGYERAQEVLNKLKK